MPKIYNVHLKQPERACGGCTLCCKVLMIRELDKPKDHWCPHARKGVGCGIYPGRPDSCQEFKCLWLMGLTLPDQRPDRVHGVLQTTTDGGHLVLHEDPGFPGVARARLKTYIDAFIATGENYVVVVCGERRTLIGRPDLVARTLIEKSQDGLTPETYRIVTQPRDL